MVLTEIQDYGSTSRTFAFFCVFAHFAFEIFHKHAHYSKGRLRQDDQRLILTQPQHVPASIAH